MRLYILRFCLFLPFLMAMQTSDAQITTGLYSYKDGKIYQGKFNSIRDCLMTVTDDAIYKGNSTHAINKLYNLKDGKIYNKLSTTRFGCLYTITDDAIYAGETTSFLELKYTIHEGKIYKGRSKSKWDCLFTITDDAVYKGASTAAYNKIMIIEEYPNAAVIGFLLGLIDKNGSSY